MGHKKNKKEEEKLDLKSYEDKLDVLKRSVKELKKIKEREEDIRKLEKKKKKILKEMKNGHK
jgi:hypothetical protein